ncbi:DUF1003 domain-containing protein [Prosthecomicrobium pneumaticum]|uniref:Putative membrane protein n=1 Tax=Prosthecomicrobium pneumaticum TaxID=81895 RepID=A0A7W9CTU4_9HYPH|nr:DUF1003 domain-containing protein [Prosthecomicrobium pneumaticum]MBB5751531.1 putative membrane protein [Prosthecomicrobium pneumaticum]
MSERTEQERGGAVAAPLERNIRALMARREREIAEAGLSERLSGAIADFTGSMWSVALHLVVFGLWILVNLGWLPLVPAWDPSFVMLAMVASVEAIFLSTFVLVNQNRLARIDDRRADLTLQIGLLTEYELTKLAELTAALARHVQGPGAVDPELEALTEEVAPEAVLDEIDRNRPE